MIVTLCGSIAFIDEMVNCKNELEKHGHTVLMPLLHVADGAGKLIPVKEYYTIRKAEPNEEWVWERKAQAIHAHFDKVAQSDAILVLNKTKNGIPGYIGSNTLMEMGLAFHLRKPIYLYEEIPAIPSREEILGMHPIIIHADLSRIRP